MRPNVYRAVSIFAALVLYAAVEDLVRGSIGRMTARRDVWRAGFDAGYDRGYHDGHRSSLTPVPPIHGRHHPPH